MSDKPKQHSGLSYSSFTEYQGCNRKWFLRRVLKLPIDTDASEDTEAFNVGKAFHKCLEDTKHNLTGFTLQACADVCVEFGLEDPDTAAMIYAMLSKYKKVHEKSGLKVVSCETTIESPVFYGVIDAVLYEEGVGFWICDIKTAGSWTKSNINAAASHTQLNIYAKYADLVAYAVGMKDAPFLGCRLRTTVKSRIGRKANEEISSYIKRMAEGIASYDISIPVGVMPVDKINKVHAAAAARVLSAKAEDEDNYPPNFNNCMSYFKPCEHYSKCHGRNFSEIPAITVSEA